MKRFGYTLAEALIALAIVGVVAATMLPLANKFMPDTNKVLYLKTYDSLVEAIHQVAVNTNLYPLTDDKYSYTNAPLANTSSVTVDEVEYTGNNKLGKILATMFGEENPTETNDKISFTTQNGVSIGVITEREPNGDNITYKTTIEIDVNGDKGKNSLFSDTCPNPDKFQFEVAANGKIIAVDIKGQEYLATRTNSRKLTKDASETIRDKLGISGKAELPNNDLIIALEILPKTPTVSPNKEPIPINPVNPVVPINPVDPVDPVNPVVPINPVGPVVPIDPPPSYTCSGCLTKYFPTETCNCPRCGSPIICYRVDTEPQQAK